VERRSRTQWTRLRQLDDRDIDYSDIPRTTPEFWASAVVVHPFRKVPLSLRLDEDVLAWFKSQGARYQTRINAVLRAYVERHSGRSRTVKEPPATYAGALLADLEAARERYEALENLPALIGPRILEYTERRIRADAERLPILKLPVLFFFLVRRDPSELRQFDAFLGHLRQTPHRKRNLPGLVARLRDDTEYRQATSAIFEVEILRALLDAAPSNSVDLYPRIGKTQNRADAVIRLRGKPIFIEIKLLSQNAKQERIQDIGIETSQGHPEPSEREMRELGIQSVGKGVVTRWGDPYGDALRVIGTLTEKPGQLDPDAPNVVCLGLADLLPHVTSVEWAIKAVFSGSSTIPRIVAERTGDAAKVKTLVRLAREAQPQPRLTGVLVFDFKEGRAAPVRAFLNEQPARANRLTDHEWGTLRALFGFSKVSHRKGD